jgi:hypothetical protein
LGRNLWNGCWTRKRLRPILWRGKQKHENNFNISNLLCLCFCLSLLIKDNLIPSLWGDQKDTLPKKNWISVIWIKQMSSFFTCNKDMFILLIVFFYIEM